MMCYDRDCPHERCPYPNKNACPYPTQVLHYNEGIPSDILPLYPRGTNSTMFTGCCGSAICDDQRCCPSCGREVIGANADSRGDRARIRWANATRLWKRS